MVYDIVDGTAVGETHYTSAGTATMYMMYIHDENGAVNGIGLWYPGNTEWTYYYFVKNLQGDVLEVYNENHSCVASYSYDAWGNILTKSGSLADINPFRYRGYYFDNESWFYYLQSRYYDPAIGRFINADAFTSTGQGILGNNMFAYCNNNPVMNSDPSGETLIGAMIGGAVGGALISVVSHITTTANATVGSTLSALTVGAVTGALGGLAGSIKAVKTAASIGTGLIAGIYAGATSSGDIYQKISIGVYTGLVTAVGTYGGASLDTSGFDRFGTAAANYATTVLVGSFSEPTAVVGQQYISNNQQTTNGAHHSDWTYERRKVQSLLLPA